MSANCQPGKIRFEEYKLFIEDTARFSERRQTVNNTYVAVNSLLLTAVSFLVKDTGLATGLKVFVVALMLTAGIFICSQWIGIIINYKSLIGHRMRCLMKMEERVDDGCFNMYLSEQEALYSEEGKAPSPIIKLMSHTNSRKWVNFSDRERRLPSVFIVVYTIFMAVVTGLYFFAPAKLTVQSQEKSQTVENRAVSGTEPTAPASHQRHP